MWSSWIPMIGSKPGNYSVVARIGAVADTAMFVVAKGRRPRLRVPLRGEWPLTTDSIRYTALPTDKVWTPVYACRVAATFHNRLYSFPKRPRRAKLIRKGMVYSPAHGDMAFTVPLFDEFMRRAMPTFSG